MFSTGMPRIIAPTAAPWTKATNDRAVEESAVPEPAHAGAAIAELERDTTEDQAEQHQQDRQVEGAEKYRVDRREGRKEAGADHHQPGLVAVPERRDAGHHLPALGLIARGAEEDADADIETVEDHVEEDRGGDDPGPEQGERAWLHRRHPFAPGWLPVALAAVSAKASGRLGVAFGIASALPTGPSRSSL